MDRSWTRIHQDRIHEYIKKSSLSDIFDSELWIGSLAAVWMNCPQVTLMQLSITFNGTIGKKKQKTKNRWLLRNLQICCSTLSVANYGPGVHIAFWTSCPRKDINCKSNKIAKFYKLFQSLTLWSFKDTYFIVTLFFSNWHLTICF